MGTGFHPELTGRENIYLNGAILGMTRAEINRKFDEIVAFAEIDQFLDTPVKRYSSGMYVRLAFAVAAHLEPEILMVDEVLAVGDAAFQKKCFTKIKEIVKNGRTILLVSHAMSSITEVCKRAILLADGCVSKDGLSHEVVRSYLNAECTTLGERVWSDPRSAPQGEIVRLRAVRVRSERGAVVDSIDIRNAVSIEMEYEVIKSGYILLPNFQFYNAQGVHAFSGNDLDTRWRRQPRPRGKYISRVYIPGNFLSAGTVSIAAGLETVAPTIHQFYEAEAVSFQVFDSLDLDSARGDFTGDMGGVLRPMLKWDTEFTESVVT